MPIRMKGKYLLLFGLLAGCSGSGGKAPVPSARIGENASRSLTGQTAVFEAGRNLTGDSDHSLQFMAHMAPPEPSVIANKSKSTYEAMLGSIRAESQTRKLSQFKLPIRQIQAASTQAKSRIPSLNVLSPHLIMAMGTLMLPPRQSPSRLACNARPRRCPKYGAQKALARLTPDRSGPFGY